MSYAKNLPKRTKYYYSLIKRGIKELTEEEVRANEDDFLIEPVADAASSGDIEKLKKLLTSGNPYYHFNIKDVEGETPLSQTLDNFTPDDGESASDFEVVKFLVENGADVNTSDDYGKTILMSAVSNGDKEIVEFLLDAGANTSAKDEKGRTVFDYTNSEALKTLLRAYSRSRNASASVSNAAGNHQGGRRLRKTKYRAHKKTQKRKTRRVRK